MNRTLRQLAVATALLTAPFWAAAQFEPVNPAPGGFGAQSLPDVVATVDGEPITRETFVQALNMATQRLLATPQAQQQGITELGPRERRMVLESVINSRIAAILAERANIEVTDEEVNEFIARERERFESREVFNDFLRSQGITADDLRRQTREILKTQQFTETITGDVAVEESELRETYDMLRDAGQLNAPKTWDFRHILVRAEEGNETARAEGEEKIAAIRARIAGGEDFAEVAAEVSDDLVSRENGGIYLNVPRGRGMFDPDFEEKALAVEEGTLSEPFTTRVGWHLIQMEAIHEAGLMSFERVSDSLETQLLNRRRQEVLQSHLLEARADIPVEILVDLETAAPPSGSAIDSLLQQLDGS